MPAAGCRLLFHAGCKIRLLSSITQAKTAGCYYGEGLFVGYRYYDKKEIQPLFPFGFGLSYTTFEIFGLELDQMVYHNGEAIHVRVMVANTGSRQGREVVQLYLRDKQSSLVRPDKELKGFQAVDLQPGETPPGGVRAG